MSQGRRHLLALMKRCVVHVAIVFTVVGIVGTIALAVSGKVRETAKDVLAGAPEEGKAKPDTKTDWKKEEWAVAPDHRGVVDWVTVCNHAELPEYLRYYATIRNGAGFPSESNQDHASVSAQAVSMPASASNDTALQDDNRRYDGVLMYLTHSISEARMYLQRKSNLEFYWCEIVAVFTVLIGAATTAAVTFSHSSYGRSGSKGAHFVKFAAVSLPIVTTALGAIVAFYHPQTQWVQMSRSLSSLTLLHHQMALNVLQLKCKADPRIKGLVEEWAKRFADINTVATAATQWSSDNNPGEK